ncbi:hypothetical protein SNEBB_003763 [Seison nebaliae]|nr:hypothetical protein SNEBB_003763 [Seison nebaliae]
MIQYGNIKYPNRENDSDSSDDSFDGRHAPPEGSGYVTRQKTRLLSPNQNEDYTSNYSTHNRRSTSHRNVERSLPVPPDENQSKIPRKCCHCSKSQCLKLYCECFQSGVFCHECNCQNCRNNIRYEGERNMAIRACLERNASAFRSKIGGSERSGENKHLKGCNCRKSNCKKRYCECFEAKILCSEHCKCTGCENTSDHFPMMNQLVPVTAVAHVGGTDATTAIDAVAHAFLRALKKIRKLKPLNEFPSVQQHFTERAKEYADQMRGVTEGNKKRLNVARNSLSRRALPQCLSSSIQRIGRDGAYEKQEFVAEPIYYRLQFDWMSKDLVKYVIKHLLEVASDFYNKRGLQFNGKTKENEEEIVEQLLKDFNAILMRIIQIAMNEVEMSYVGSLPFVMDGELPFITAQISKGLMNNEQTRDFLTHLKCDYEGTLNVAMNNNNNNNNNNNENVIFYRINTISDIFLPYSDIELSMSHPMESTQNQISTLLSHEHVRQHIISMADNQLIDMLKFNYQDFDKQIDQLYCEGDIASNFSDTVKRSIHLLNSTTEMDGLFNDFTSPIDNYCRQVFLRSVDDKLEGHKASFKQRDWILNWLYVFIEMAIIEGRFPEVEIHEKMLMLLRTIEMELSKLKIQFIYEKGLEFGRKKKKNVKIEEKSNEGSENGEKIDEVQEKRTEKLNSFQEFLKDPSTIFRVGENSYKELEDVIQAFNENQEHDFLSAPLMNSVATTPEALADQKKVLTNYNRMLNNFYDVNKIEFDQTRNSRFYNRRLKTVKEKVKDYVLQNCSAASSLHISNIFTEHALIMKEKMKKELSEEEGGEETKFLSLRILERLLKEKGLMEKELKPTEEINEEDMEMNEEELKGRMTKRIITSDSLIGPTRNKKSKFVEIEPGEVVNKERMEEINEDENGEETKKINEEIYIVRDSMNFNKELLLNAFDSLIGRTEEKKVNKNDFEQMFPIRVSNDHHQPPKPYPYTVQHIHYDLSPNPHLGMAPTHYVNESMGEMSMMNERNHQMKEKGKDEKDDDNHEILSNYIQIPSNTLNQLKNGQMINLDDTTDLTDHQNDIIMEMNEEGNEQQYLNTAVLIGPKLIKEKKMEENYDATLDMVDIEGRVKKVNELLAMCSFGNTSAAKKPLMTYNVELGKLIATNFNFLTRTDILTLRSMLTTMNDQYMPWITQSSQIEDSDSDDDDDESEDDEEKNIEIEDGEDNLKIGHDQEENVEIENEKNVEIENEETVEIGNEKDKIEIDEGKKDKMEIGNIVEKEVSIEDGDESDNVELNSEDESEDESEIGDNSQEDDSDGYDNEEEDEEFSSDEEEFEEEEEDNEVDVGIEGDDERTGVEDKRNDFRKEVENKRNNFREEIESDDIEDHSKIEMEEKIDEEFEEDDNDNELLSEEYDDDEYDYEEEEEDDEDNSDSQSDSDDEDISYFTDDYELASFLDNVKSVRCGILTPDYCQSELTVESVIQSRVFRRSDHVTPPFQVNHDINDYRLKDGLKDNEDDDEEVKRNNELEERPEHLTSEEFSDFFDNIFLVRDTFLSPENYLAIITAIHSKVLVYRTRLKNMECVNEMPIVDESVLKDLASTFHGANCLDSQYAKLKTWDMVIARFIKAGRDLDDDSEKEKLNQSQTRSALDGLSNLSNSLHNHAHGTFQDMLAMGYLPFFCLHKTLTDSYETVVKDQLEQISENNYEENNYNEHSQYDQSDGDYHHNVSYGQPIDNSDHIMHQNIMSQIPSHQHHIRTPPPPQPNHHIVSHERHNYHGNNYTDNRQVF